MTSAAPYSLAVSTPARPVIDQGAGDGAASHVRTEERNGVLYVIGPDGIAQPVASERLAARVAASVRHFTPRV